MKKIEIPTSKIFGFTYRYPKSFLEKLAKDLGFKWTYVKATCIPKEDIEIRPLPPPSETLYFLDYKIGPDQNTKKDS